MRFVTRMGFGVGAALLLAAAASYAWEKSEYPPGEAVTIAEVERDLGELPPGAIVDVEFRVVNASRRPRQLLNVSKL